MSEDSMSIGRLPHIGPERRQMAGQFLRFGVVGVAGFVVDAGVLTAALALGFGPWLGRLLSYVAAASVTFALNRSWTFRAETADGPQEIGRLRRQWALFLAVNLVGFTFNYGTYAALLAGSPLVARNPVLGVAAGALAGMVGNFALSRRFVFRGATPTRPLAGT